MHDYDFELICLKVIQEQASEQEEAWLREALKSEENQKIYHSIQLIYNNLPEQNLDFDANSAWNLVSPKLASSQVNMPHRTAVKYYIAAAVVLIFSTVFFVFYLNRSKPENKELTKNQFKPVPSRNEKQFIDLADGTKIILSANAKLDTVQGFIQNRRLQLEGNAYFRVAKDSLRPFQIETSHCNILVLGTTFSVENNRRKTEIKVNSGRVKIYNKKTKSLQILTGGQGIVATDTGLQRIENYSQLSDFTEYRKFEDQSIGEVLEYLRAMYEVEIVFAGNESIKTTVECVFPAKKIEDILFELAFQNEGNFTKKNGKYFLLIP